MDILRRGCAEIISEEDLEKKLDKSIKTGKPLRIKLGLDPSAPDIHLGHAVVLRKMREFQELGHEVFLVVGDFTGRIGDPSGKSETRPQLSMEQIMENAKTYQEQAFKILDPDRTHTVFNGEWLSKLTFEDVINLSSRYTVARMLEREEFRDRFHEERPIYIHEFFYPFMQAYDSIALDADVELGGTDQKFNILFGRMLQREFNQEPQVAMLMPILVGLDGVKKMSKSLGNYVGVTENPKESYGKIMSIPDEVMMTYYELATGLSEEDIQAVRKGFPPESCTLVTLREGLPERLLPCTTAMRQPWMQRENSILCSGKAVFLRIFLRLRSFRKTLKTARYGVPSSWSLRVLQVATAKLGA